MWSVRMVRILGTFAAAVFSVTPVAGADFPDRPSGRFGGVYKVMFSTDPMFPATDAREYFLDFGCGIQSEKLSGSVAVSVRRNPNVQVRIMAWQYFPAQGRIFIGNPCAAGSSKAVAAGIWRIKANADGLLLEREGFRMLLQAPDPGDY